MISTANGEVSITATKDVVLGANGDISSTGNASLVATTGNVTFNANTTLNAGAGQVSITGNGDVTITGISTTNDTASAVSITSQNGAIKDAGEVVNDITATSANAVVTLSAKSGIGAVSDSLNTNVTRIAFTNSTSGNVVIDEADSLTVSGINSAPNGVVTLTLLANDATLTVNSAGLSTNNGVVTLTADDMNIAGPVSVGGTADVNLLTKDATQAINLGSTGTSGTVLALSDAELDRITTGGVLRIGSSTQNGSISISEIISPANASTLSLITDGSVTTTGNGAIVESNLAISANGSVLVNGGNTDVDVVAIKSTTGSITLNDKDGFTVGTVDNVNGVSAAASNVTLTAGNADVGANNDVIITDTAAARDIQANGAISITLRGANATLYVNSNADVNSANGNVSITADDMDLSGTITASASAANDQIVTLASYTANSSVNLGSTTTSADGVLDLSNGELNRIQGDVLRIATASGKGNVTVSAPIVLAPVQVPVLHITAAGAIIDGNASGDDFTVGNLALEAANGIGSTDAIEIAAAGSSLNLAAKNTGTGNIDLAVTGNVVVTTVDGVSGLTNSATGFVRLTAAGSLTVQDTSATNDVSANGAITLLASDALTLATGVVVRSNSGGDITLIANNGDAAGTDDLTTGNVSILTSGNITLNADPDGNKTGGGISLANGTQLAGTTSSGANNVTLQSAKDIRVTGIKAVNTISVTSTAGSIVDDGTNRPFSKPRM